MKRIALFFVITAMLGLTGCNKDAQIEAFITELNSVTQDVVAKIDANPTSAGVDEAQKAFDARKSTLRAKWDAIKDAVGFQVSKAVKDKLESSVKENIKALTDVSMRNVTSLAADKNAATKFQRLMMDFSSMFAPPSTGK